MKTTIALACPICDNPIRVHTGENGVQLLYCPRCERAYQPHELKNKEFQKSEFTKSSRTFERSA